MTAYRKDPPDERIREMIFYRDGNLYWKPEAYGKGKIKGKPLGCLDNHGYQRVSITLDGKRRFYKVHRLIYWLLKNEWPEQIDHENKNRSDNRIENLRPATTRLNQMNRDKPITNKSGYIGVHLCKHGKKWVATYKDHGVYGFRNAKDAALFRDLMVFYNCEPGFRNFNFLGKTKIRINGELI
ncbi:hypothetical protein GEM21_05490 [Salmonella enterica]|nr:hypothetical protein [Salmonella enterica]EEO2148465.1 hypothetical protein [Salmonella enterica]EIL8912101.1 HNH endonuclease [Salmonella enterica]